jgi:DNA helicase II / ATP-dependent DNA helicase PcrA
VQLPNEFPADPLIDGLNAPQREAVLTTEGPVLMLAGAGTGKTAALTARLAHIVRSRLAWPSEILCVTFTNKAAREMKERVGQLVGPAVEGMPWLGTFHAIAAKMLRRHAELAGLQSNYTIIDTDDQLRVLKQLIQAEGLDEKRWPARQLAGCIDRWKNKGLLPQDLSAADSEAYANGQGQKFYRLYQDRLKALNACDFGDLLLHMLNILRANREILEQYQQRFKYIMVDEYQDTNQVQYLWLRLLAQTRKNICVVGDDDQSIYSWRGAEVANILRFEQDFPGAKVIKLEQNYRSTPDILAAASGLIDANSQRLGKTLWTERNGGDKVRVIGVWDGPEEARRIGEEIERLEREGASLPRSRSSCAPSSRPASSKTASSRSACPTRSSAVSGSMSARKCAMPSPICASSPSRATTWRSSGSTTPPSAALATRRWKSCTATPARAACR